ncbi:MAG: hypothetical protein FWD68_14480 [Alphaproteobacteria bacterium]|nr:hypothetical protein [Alphaproteobacteria bacterium]
MQNEPRRMDCSGRGDPGRLAVRLKCHFVTPLNPAGAFSGNEFKEISARHASAVTPLTGMRNENGVTLRGGRLREACASLAKTTAPDSIGLS